MKARRSPSRRIFSEERLFAQRILPARRHRELATTAKWIYDPVSQQPGFPLCRDLIRAVSLARVHATSGSTSADRSGFFSLFSFTPSLDTVNLCNLNLVNARSQLNSRRVLRLAATNKYFRFFTPGLLARARARACQRFRFAGLRERAESRGSKRE